MLKHGILGLLNYHDLTGYEIMEVFRDSLNFFWSAQTSQIYRELQTLEKNAWVGKTPVSQQGKPDKNVYSITEQGRQELLRWLALDNVGLSPRTPILMKVFFLGERSREDNILFFQTFQKQCRQFLQSLEPVPAYIRAYGDEINAGDKSLYWQMTVDYGRRNMQMYIDWTQSCIEKLQQDGAENEHPQA